MKQFYATVTLIFDHTCSSEVQNKQEAINEITKTYKDTYNIDVIPSEIKITSREVKED